MATQLEQDARRVEAELSTLVGSTDPFASAVRAARMAMLITDPRRPDNPVVFVNDAFCSLTGYSRGEILGTNCRFLQGPATDRATVARIRAAVAEAQTLETDLLNYRKSGEPFWNRLLLAPVYDKGGELTYFFASQVDVTRERERLEGLESHNAALAAELARKLHEQREREAELRFTLDAARFGSWTLDLATEDLTTSAAFRESFGRDLDQPFSYADLRAALHAEDRERVKHEIAECLASGAQRSITFRAMTPGGDLRWVQGRARPIYAADGTPLRLSGVSLDITEDKRAEGLRQALADLGSTFRNRHDPAELSFEAGKLLGQALGVVRAGFAHIGDEQVEVERDWTAPGFASLSGIMGPKPAAVAADLRRGLAVVVPDIRTDPRIGNDVEHLAASGIGAMVVVPIIEDGRLRATMFVHDEAPRPWRDDEVRFIEEVTERTGSAVERRRAEQSLAAFASSLEGQVAERTRDLLAAEEALRQSQKMEAIGQLTGGVAHDFNNLLTVIRSSVDLMRRPNLPEDRRRRYIDAISDTVNRAAKLTGQLLAFARRQALNPQVFELGERLAGMADMIDSVTGARIRVLRDLSDTPCFVRADASQFETAVVNMAVNARDAMEGEGALTLRLERSGSIPSIRGHAGVEGRYAAISISDTGGGIAADTMGRIFEPFFTTKSVGKGTGLGLSQVFGFAKQSGGDVDVQSEMGQGATFTLYLPEVEAGEGRELEPIRQTGQALAGGGRRVLLVEDNVEVGRFSEQVLQDLGFQIDWATTAREALIKLGDGQGFDAVFSDVVMPGMSGIDLAKQIRAQNPTMPVVLTSGYSHVLAEEGSHGFELLHKPYSAEQVSRALRRAMAANRATGSSA